MMPNKTKTEPEKPRFPVRVLLTLNRLFPRQRHPLNLNNEGQETYAQWQFEKGADTLRCYEKRFSSDEIIRGKSILDMGCGAGGKSLYYVSLGAKSVTGADIVERYREESDALAHTLGLDDGRFTFLCASATDLPLPDASFDTILMNDFMEHVSEPDGALREAMRLLRPGGRLYLNFPPYYHPFGAHLSDAVNIPWAHVFFSEKTLIEAYRILIRDLPDAADRLSLRFSRDEAGTEHISYINKMTLKRFETILSSLSLTPLWSEEIPLRSFLKPLAQFPLTKEAFVKMKVCVIEKGSQNISKEDKEKPHD